MKRDLISQKTIEFIESQSPNIGKCAYCGKVDDLRPYGKNNVCICFTCGMLTENRSTTNGMADKRLSEIRNEIKNQLSN